MQLKYLAAFIDSIENPSLIIGPRIDLVQHTDLASHSPTFIEYGGFVGLKENEKPLFFGTSYSTNKTTPDDSPNMIEGLQNSFENGTWVVKFLTNRYVKNYPIINIINKEELKDIIDLDTWLGDFIEITKDVGMALLEEFDNNDRIEDSTVLKIKGEA